MHTDDGEPQVYECCKRVISAHQRRLSRHNAKVDRIRQMAIVALFAIGVPFLFIFDPPKVWGYMNTVTVVIGLLAWLVLIHKFFDWMKLRTQRKQGVGKDLS